LRDPASTFLSDCRDLCASEVNDEYRTDIAALYCEFTDALTEVLAENVVGIARVADWRERALQ
jgi:hypothetical protein